MIHPGQRMQQPAGQTAAHTHLLVRECRLRQGESGKRNKREARQNTE
jgi:hypothetical protein